jgi:flavodoxin
MSKSKPKVLIVYYSRSGNTRSVAQALSIELGCPKEELVDMRRRSGLLGIARSGLDGLLGRETALCAPLHDVSEYDLVIVGTPVWNRSVSAPVRTYLGRNRGRFRNVAFFATHSFGRSRAFEQMAEIAQKSPCATLVVTEREIDDAEVLAKMRDFADRLRGLDNSPFSSADRNRLGRRFAPQLVST